MITEKISNGGVLSGTINASSNLTMGIGSSNNLVGGNINTFTKETDPTIPDYIKAISKEDIAGWDNNAVVNEEQNKTLVGLEELIDTITPKNTAKGELVHITDALCLPTFENKVSGNVKQETTNGNQLLDINTVTPTDATISDGIITSKTLGNWGTITWKFPNIPLSRTIYYVSFDLRIKSGTCKYLNKLNMWESDIFVQSYDFIVNPTPSNIYQRYCIKFDLTNNTTLYNLNMINIQVGDIVVDAILEVKDIMLSTSSDYTYEKYTGELASPNPDYPQEIEVLEGYNLFDVNSITENTYISDDGATGTSSVTNLSDYIEVESKTKYILSYDYSSLLNTTQRNIIYYDKNRTYISGSICMPTDKIHTITTPSNAKYLRFSYDKNCYDIQLTKGATKKPYFPYGCVGVKNVGKNLYTFSTTDKTNNISGVTCVYDSKNQELTINGTSTQKEVIFHTKPWGTLANKTYTITIFYVSGSVTGEAIWYNQDGNAKWSGYDIPLKNKTISSTKTYNVDLNFDTTSFIRANDAGVVFNNYKIKIMVEENPIATSYEPYQEQIVYLDLKGNWAGKARTDKIKDYLVTDKKHLWLVKNVDRYDFTGDELCYYQNENNKNIIVVQTYVDYVRPSGNYNKANIICSHFTTEKYYDETNDNLHKKQNGIAITWQGNKGEIFLGTKSIKENITFNELKQWLKENNVYFIYQRKTPKIIELGELPEPIKTFEGTNNIQLLANLDTEIEVKYALDVKKYADDRYLELTNALVSTGANL